ncbi:MAG: hydrogenase, partial [Candidatus Omnitrophica bacterium CG12_big_fil_rev_8_21_14_0_65_45_16]
MRLFLLSLEILAFSAVLVLFLDRFRKLCHFVFVASLVAACSLNFFVSFPFLRGGETSIFRIPWSVPFGEFTIGLDPLSAFFLMTIGCVALASGIYGCGYLQEHHEKKNLGVHYFFYLLLITLLLVVVTARNAVLFLTAWELMTIIGYFLVTFYDEKKSVREAGYLYLIVTHCGTFCLLVMFALMGQAASSMDFDQMALAHYAPGLTGLLFILGLVGFGAKAGFFPIHIWLPHAHPAAPSHVSALFSGFVIKTGIYGLLRLIFIIKDLPAWSGPVVLAIGGVSGVFGVLYALGQHEIKKLLAYHSIENIGIIALGIGIGLLGNASGHESIALIGYAGGLLHVLNHAVFKSLLFLSAGSVIRSTGTGEIDAMGGLLKFLPFTGHLFLIGSLSICGLPLFNGFISEWLVYRA